MSGQNLNDLLIDDFCVTNRLSRFNKQNEVASPLGAAQNAQPTMISALGCFPVVSHRQASGNNSVLSRTTLVGDYNEKVLGSSDGGDRTQPGPTSHLSTAPVALLSGSVSNPFPVSNAAFLASHIFGSDLWFSELGGGFQLQHSDGHIFFGFGGAQAPYWVLNLPPGRFFNGVPSGRLESHTYDNYVLMPVVSFPCEPLSLGWISASSWYAWSKRTPFVTIRTNQVGGGGSGQQWELDLFWQEVHPALLASTGPTLSATLAGDGTQNGSGLHRSYCYKSLETGMVMPGFGGGTLTRSYTVAQGDLRNPLVLYTFDDSGATQPATFSLTFEGITPTPAGASLPTPQRNPFDAGSGPTFINFNQCSQYAIPTNTVKTEPGSGRLFVGLDFTLTIPGGFSKTGTIEYVKDPLVSQSDWNATPRYYEMVGLFTLFTGLL